MISPMPDLIARTPAGQAIESLAYLSHVGLRDAAEVLLHRWQAGDIDAAAVVREAATAVLRGTR